MNQKEGYYLPLDVAIYTNYLEAQRAKTYDGARLLLVARFRLGFKHFTAVPISASLSPSIFPLHLTALS